MNNYILKTETNTTVGIQKFVSLKINTDSAKNLKGGIIVISDTDSM